MSKYQAPLRDIRFALFDVLGAEAVYRSLRDHEGAWRHRHA